MCLLGKHFDRPHGVICPFLLQFIFSKDGAPASNTTGEQRLVRVSDYEDYARQHMDPDAWMYFNLGASTLTTKADNEAAFQRYRLMPNYLMNVADFNSSLEVLGSKVSMPIGLSPAAVYKWAHPDGDREAARAAASLGAVHILSALASTTIEDVAEAIPDAVRWQQVQFTVPRNSTLDIVQRAEKAGCRAIVVTIDEPVIRISYELMRHTDGEVKLPDFVEPVNQRYPSDSMVDPRQSWADIAWLKKQTSLPIVLKGLLNPDSVPLAKQAGVSGILVSNHGGRSDCTTHIIIIIIIQLNYKITFERFIFSSIIYLLKHTIMLNAIGQYACRKCSPVMGKAQ